MFSMKNQPALGYPRFRKPSYPYILVTLYQYFGDASAAAAGLLRATTPRGLGLILNTAPPLNKDIHICKSLISKIPSSPIGFPHDSGQIPHVKKKKKQQTVAGCFGSCWPFRSRKIAGKTSRNGRIPFMRLEDC